MGRLTRWIRRRGLLPAVSDTERAALAAGTVWLDGDFFRGRLDLDSVLATPWPRLSERERAFLDGPVATVCAMVDPWRLSEEGELPTEVWAYLRAERFFGLGIPPEWGGLGFSALAQSTVFATLASHALPLSAVVLIPNSVGPAELLLHHGTPEQRQHYLPLLASGAEIPCFALTEPAAGSDAAALASTAVVEAGPDGTPWLRLDFEKRYITLAPVATLIGLACQLRDPQRLLGGEAAPGITVVLVPAATPGVDVGRRHDPLGVPFPNGPIFGRGVRLPATQILGGPAAAGQGWRMLMEALSAGRALSLPAQSAGGLAMACRIAGAHARVREQFGVPIARFEGIAEKLAELGAIAYQVDAARVLTAGAVDAGERPAVLGAALKQASTELCRQGVCHAMDVLAGAAICRGPANRLADGWLAAPIGITVEGANILTRTLIVCGQGVVRSHPWASRALAALDADRDGALLAALLGHGGALLGNAARVVWHAAGGGGGIAGDASIPGGASPAARREIRRATRGLRVATARFALAVDLTLLAVGGGLKSRGALAGRLTDALSALLLGTATLRRFLADGAPDADLALFALASANTRHEVARSLAGVAANLPGAVGRLAGAPLGLLLRLDPEAQPPADTLRSAAAATLTTPGPGRDRLTALAPALPGTPTAELDATFAAVVASEPLRARQRRARRQGGAALDAAEEAELAALAARCRDVLAAASWPAPDAAHAAMLAARERGGDAPLLGPSDSPADQAPDPAVAR